MSNQTQIQKLLKDLDNFSKGRIFRADFALDFIDTIESLDDVDYDILDQARDWQYKIETSGDVMSLSSQALCQQIRKWISQIGTRVC